MDIKKIKIQDPFKNLFRIYDEDYKEVLEDIRQNGYDQNEPILIWKEKGVLIDGHTRLEAAKEVKLKDIPVNLLEFDGEDAALKYSIKRNKNKGRRVTAGDKFRLFEALDRVGAYGGDYKSEDYKKNRYLNLNTDNKPSAEKTAKLIGTGITNVNKMRTILGYADADDIEGIKNDDLSIDAVWKLAKEVKQKIEDELNKESKFNATNENIEWAKWTWNPVTGCEHGCKYCYARDIANRFYKEKFEPTFRPKRLTAPKSTKIPESRKDEPGINNAFVCSMADLFGDWVPQEWIDEILSVCDENSQWNYLFLTKNPKRLTKIDWPKTAWVGTTIDVQSRIKDAENIFSKFKAPVKFFSCEPLQEELTFNSLKMIDWIIIGGRSKSSGMDEGQPKWEWVEKILNKARQDNVKVYFKPNLKVKPKEYPEVIF